MHYSHQVAFLTVARDGESVVGVERQKRHLSLRARLSKSSIHFRKLLNVLNAHTQRAKLEAKAKKIKRQAKKIKE